MNKEILYLFVFIVINTNSFAQSDVIENANKLIENKNYESAFNVLNDADPNNDNPEIVITKTDLFLTYFVSSIMHQLFALKDLETNEEISDIRGSNGDFSMFEFSPDSLLSRLIKKHPNNYKLHKSLGNFYHEIHLKYPKQWLEPDSIVVERFSTNYKTAYEHGIYDYWSSYGIGYSFLIKQDYKNAIPYLEKSIELNDEFPSSHYNLAYAYLYLDMREKAIENAKMAMDLYDEPQFKADAAIMIAVTYSEMDQFEKSWGHYVLADKINSNDYYTIKPLLDLEVRLEKDSYKERTKEFFLLAPGNPTIFKDLMSIYWAYKKQVELIDFFDNQHKNFLQDNKVNGNLYFYKAKIQYDGEDYINAKLNFLKAEKILKNVFEPNHRVFQIIESYTKEI